VSFVHLSLHSEYSLHDSLVRIDQLMDGVADAGMPAVAVTDDCNMFATIKAYKAAMASGVKPIIGAQMLIQTSRLSTSLVTVLCRDNDGYRALSEVMSLGYEKAIRDKLNRPIIPLSWFKDKSAGLIALSGAREGEIGTLLMQNREKSLVMDSVSEFRELFGDNFYIELQRIGHGADDRYVREAVQLAMEVDLPVVATNNVRFLQSDEFSTHEIRDAIAQKRTVAEMRKDHTPNCTQHQFLKSPEEMIELFSDIPAAIENTLVIAAQCSVDLSLGKNYLPAFPAPEGMTEGDLLEKMSFDGLETRFRYYFKTDEAIAEHRQEYEDRLRFELNTIKQMGFPGYFLIVADFIRWAKENDIPVGPGRGSGAGSLVAYALGITDLNPIPYALLFERFLNPERVSMPDFDIDFCMEKRDRVIDYVAEAYGHHAVSQIITYGTMAAKSAIKRVTNALGLPGGLGNNMANLIPKAPDITLEKAMKLVPELKILIETDQDARTVWDYSVALEGLPLQTGKHAGGVVIAPTKLTDFSPIYCDADGSNLVTQFDKDDVESAGLVKFDFLGLKNLTTIDYAVKSINARRLKNGEKPIDILDIDLKDDLTYALLQRCETTAVFQLESSGMKNLVKALKPDCLEDLIALVALFRPGPLQSGMVGDFVDRKHGRAEVSYPHPSLEPVLKNTYGVIVYQEQVMQIAQVMAGYTLGGADMLRRAMGKKKPEEMAKQRQIFVDGCVNNKIPAELAESVFDLMAKFAEYGFNKSHSAAYALIAYQTAFLKAHYPADFMAAALTCDIGNTDKIVKLIHECRQMGLEVIPPDINHSNFAFTPHNGKILYGMGSVDRLGEVPILEVLKNREKVGEFENLVDFLYRVPLRKNVIESCINAGMFDFSGIDRSELLAVYPLALEAGKHLRKHQGQGMLFDMEIPPVPRMTVPAMEINIRLDGERKALGLYLTGHPYEQYRAALRPALTCNLADLVTNLEDETVEREDRYYNVTVAGLMTDFDCRSNTKGTYASFKLDDGTARMECTVWNKEYNDFQAFLDNHNLVVLQGRVRTNEKTKTFSLIIDTVQPLQAFLENQSGKIVVNLPEGASVIREMGKVHGLGALNDEGTMRVFIQGFGDEEANELPIPPISANGPAMQKLVSLWGDNVKIEYVKQYTRKVDYRVARDTVPTAVIEDMDQHRSALRLALEKALSAAEAAMTGSEETEPTPG
jgi:DNA polymerase-3 subunit alpha